MTRVLYRKWRPQRWEEVVGQDHVIDTLQNAIVADRVAHAYLFAGPRGTGKTTTARLLAKAVNCLHEDLESRPCDECDHCKAISQGRFLDLIEIDAASNTSVDDVRDLREKINFSPNRGRYKVYIIDEVHMLSTAAFNALLKTLEEPPPHAIFILATTEVHKIPATVLSRCQGHEFRRIPVADIVRHLETLIAEENLEVDPAALTLVSRQATGSLRDAISLVDQLASSGGLITLELAQRVLGTAPSQAVLSLITAMLSGEAAKGLDQIRTTLDAGTDPRQFARQIVAYLRAILLFRMGNADHVEATSDVRAEMAVHAESLPVSDLIVVIRAFNNAATEARYAWQPALPLELAFLESLEALARDRDPIIRSAPSEATELAEVPSPVPQPPSDDEPQGEAQESVSGEGVSLGKITRSWMAVLAAIRERNPQTQGLLNSSKPLGVKKGVLILGFASELIKSKMEKPEHLAHTREVLSEILEMDLKVHCVVSAATQGDRLKDIQGLDTDGMVAVALRDLGGEIVDIQ